MIDRLRQMAIFAKTIDHGSFRGAADKLKLSPSVVSHHVSQLEANLGVALIYRSTRKLTLTSDGERLLTATRKMLEAVESELEDISASATEPSGELRLTLPSVLSQSDLMKQIAVFSANHPRIQLSLDFSDMRRELIEDRFDIAIRMGGNSKNTATSRKLFKTHRSLVASKSYLDAQPDVQDVDDLLEMDWIKLVPAQNTPLTLRSSQGQTRTIKPDARLSTNDAQSLYRFAREHAGLALVPDFLAEDDLASGAMVCVLPHWQFSAIDVFAVWPANAPKHGLIHLVLNAISQPKSRNSTNQIVRQIA